MKTKKIKIQNVDKKTSYTVFYAARIIEGFDRDTVSSDTGMSIKRISDLEKDVGNPPGIDEIINLEDYYKNNVIMEYFIELITKGGRYIRMPRQAKETSNLEKYIALEQPTMGNHHIMTVLQISMGSAIVLRQNLEEKAQQDGLVLLPNAVIQTVIFEKYVGISKSFFEEFPEVIEYKKMRGK